LENFNGCATSAHYISLSVLLKSIDGAMALKKGLTGSRNANQMHDGEGFSTRREAVGDVFHSPFSNPFDPRN
jgi:hypothetical protein